MASLVLVHRGYDVTSSLLFVACSFLGYPVGSILAIPLLRRYERKYLLMYTIAAIAVCGLLFATVSSTILIITFGFLTTAVSNVFSNVYHVYQAEIFPTDVRATAVGWTYSLSRLSSGALPFILIPVLDAFGAVAMFTVVLVALIITFTAIAVAGPSHHAPQPGGHQPRVTRYRRPALRSGSATSDWSTSHTKTTQRRRRIAVATAASMIEFQK